MFIRSKYFLSCICLGLPAIAMADVDLPTVTIMGKTFYSYVAKKGESLFGIANRFGWDLETLNKTNPELDTPLSNGDLIYYPAPKTPKNPFGKTKEKVDKPSASNSNNHSSSGEETALNVVDRNDLSAPAKRNAKDSERDGLIYHKVEKDEDLYDIAQEYETTVEDLYKMNPGMSYENPDPGETIRIKAGSRNDSATTQMVEEEQIKGITTYKVRRGDTWSKIAENKEISVDNLKAANPGITNLKRGDVINIPSVETVEVEKLVIVTDPREETEEGRRQLYEEVHSLASGIYDEEGNVRSDAVSIAIVLNNPDTNRDMEFARGAILAVNDLKTKTYGTRLTIIDGSRSETEVMSEIEGFNPTLIVTTADKDLPEYVTTYALENSRHVVNAFDVKDESFLTNSAVIQYLAPTSYFNDEVARYFTATYPDYDLIVAGKMDGADTMGESILKAVISESKRMPQEVVIEEIGDVTLPTDNGQYLIYATPGGREDVKALLEKIDLLRDANPLADIRVIGRPNWITFADAQRDLFNRNNVLLPSRFFFDTEDRAARSFIDGFKDLYGHTPIKSYPVYSATGYDILKYFVPNIHDTGGDFNAEFKERATLQSPISLERVNNWGGVVNPCVYIVEFQPYGSAQKITLTPEE